MIGWFNFVKGSSLTEKLVAGSLIWFELFVLRVNNLISKVNNFVRSLINWSSDWLIKQLIDFHRDYWLWQHQGGMGAWSEALPTCPQSEEKMVKISHFHQIFGFLPPQKHILPLNVPPQKYFWCRHWILAIFTLVHSRSFMITLTALNLGPYFDAGYPIEPKTGNDGWPLWHKLALPNRKWISVDNLFCGMADNVAM